MQPRIGMNNNHILSSVSQLNFTQNFYLRDLCIIKVNKHRTGLSSGQWTTLGKILSVKSSFS
jgi:hypothetical protein